MELAQRTKRKGFQREECTAKQSGRESSRTTFLAGYLFRKSFSGGLPPLWHCRQFTKIPNRVAV